MYFITNKILQSGKKVRISSLEVPRNILLLNLVSNYYGISSSILETKDHDDKIREYSQIFNDQLIINDDIHTIGQIISDIQTSDCDAYFIDFVQNIGGKGNSEYERMTSVATEIQKAAVKSGKAIFDLSQVSNE